MGKTWQRQEEFIDSMHRTNPVAKFAFKQGNAAGAHASRTTRRQERRLNKIEERTMARGGWE